MPPQDCAALDRELRDLLGLSVAPIAISFLPCAPAVVAHPRAARAADTAVAVYASRDAKRFA